MPRSYFCAISLLVLVGCGEKPASVERITAVRERDSAGIRIVENPGPLPADLEVWVLDTVPLAVIGSQNGIEYELDEVTSFASFSNGSVVVALNQSSPELRLFDSTGRFIKRFGRSGEGPGEFRNIYQIAIDAHDTLWVLDHRLGRTTVFTSQGKLVRTANMSGVPQRYHAYATGALDGGRWIFSVHRPNFGKGRRVDTLEVAIAASDGQSAAIVMQLPYQHLTDGSPDHFDHRGIFELTDSLVLVGRLDRYEIRDQTAEGELRFIFRRDLEPRPIPDSAIKAIRKSASGGTITRHGATVTLPAPKLVFAPHLPAFARFRADKLGNIWVQETRVDEQNDPIHWTIFSPEGRIIARSSIPADPAAIGATDVVRLVPVGEDGIQHLRRYRVVKSRPNR